MGAGLIFVNDNKVNNLTTAAGVWLAGAIGMAIGFGYYGIALVTTIVARFAPSLNIYLSQKARRTASSKHSHTNHAHHAPTPTKAD